MTDKETQAEAFVRLFNEHIYSIEVCKNDVGSWININFKDCSSCSLEIDHIITETRAIDAKPDFT